MMEDLINKSKEQLLAEIESLKFKTISLEEIVLKVRDAQDQLHSLSKDYSSNNSWEFIDNICSYIANVIDADYVFVGELIPEKDKVKVLAGVGKGEKIKQFNYSLHGTPCEKVIRGVSCCYPAGSQKLFPNDALLKEMNIEGYVGIPLHDKTGTPIGIMVVLNTKEILKKEVADSVLKVFSTHISTEIERMQVDKKLYKVIEFSQTLLQASPAFYVAIDGNGKVILINETMLSSLGYSHDEVYGKDYISMFIPPENRDRVQTIFNQIISQREHTLNENEVLAKDGTRFMVEWHGRPVYNENGKFEYFFGFGTDLTKRRNVENALTASEELFSKLFQTNPNILTISSLEDGKMIEINDAGTTSIGLSRNEILNRTSIELGLVTNKDREFLKKLIIEQGRYDSVELTINLPNGGISTGLFYGQIISYNNQNCLFQTIVDISQWKKDQDTLHTRASIIRSIVDTSQDWIWSVNKEGIHTYSNEAIEKILGYTREEFAGTLSMNYMHPVDKERMLVQFPDYVANRKGWKGDVIRWIHKDGTIKYLESSAVPIIENDNLIGFRGVDRDITERILIEESLRNSEETYRSFFETAQDGAFVTSIDGSILNCNLGFVKLFGYKKRSDLLALNTSDLYLNEGDRDFVTTELLNNGFVANRPFKGKRKDGIIIHALITAAVKKDVNNNIVGFQGTITDITSHKLAEEALKTSEERFKILFESAPEAYYLNNLSGIIQDGNTAAEILTGFTKEEFIGKSFLDLDMITEKEVNKAKKLLSQNSRGKGTGPDEFQIKRKDNQIVYVEITTYPVTIDDKVIVLGIARDITERRKTEDELNKHRTYLEEMVNDRTADLEEKNNELERLNRLFVGREFRIKELKDKIKLLTSREK